MQPFATQPVSSGRPGALPRQPMSRASAKTAHRAFTHKDARAAVLRAMPPAGSTRGHGPADLSRRDLLRLAAPVLLLAGLPTGQLLAPDRTAAAELGQPVLPSPAVKAAVDKALAKAIPKTKVGAASECVHISTLIPYGSGSCSWCMRRRAKGWWRGFGCIGQNCGIDATLTPRLRRPVNMTTKGSVVPR